MKNKYTSKLKQEILDYASNHSLKETAKKYGCNILSISRWREEKKKNLPIPREDYEDEIARLKLQVFASENLSDQSNKKILDLQNSNYELENRIADLLNLIEHLKKVHDEKSKEWKEATEQAIKKLSEESWETNKFCSILIKRIAALMEKN